MFDRFVQNRIWKAGHKTHTGRVKDGKIVDLCGNEMQVKQFEEIFKEVVERLNKVGFSVKRVSPIKANVVIRVYRCEAWEYDGSVYCIYGSDTYVRNLGVMISSGKKPIDYERNEVRWIFYPDDMPCMKTEFVDYFVRINS